MASHINYILLIYGFSILLTPLDAFARWKTIAEADLIQTDNQTLIVVNQDGSYRMEDERRLKAQNEQGKMQLALQRVSYSAETSRVTVVSAETLVDGKTFQVDTKTIQDKPAPSADKGLTNQREIIIPFTNLKIGAEIRYKVIYQVKKPVLPGVFSMSFIYGLEFPEMAGLLTIQTPKVISQVAFDFNNHLITKISKNKDGYVATFQLVRPAYYQLIDEPSPYFPPLTIPRVDVSNTFNWEDIARPLFTQYEAQLNKPLPALFQDIAKLAASEKSETDQINRVTDELANHLTYVGDWTTAERWMIPRGHLKVITSKTGDCKDFAVSTAAILRKLGFRADVALVVRNQPDTRYILQPPAIFPSSAAFNHAIVKVILKDGTTRWVDPTNVVSYAEGIFTDLLGSPALVLNSDTKKLENIPEQDIFPSEAKLNQMIQVRADRSAEIKSSAQLKGATSLLLRQVGQMKGAEALRDILRRMLINSEKSKDPVMADFKTRRAATLSAEMTTRNNAPLYEDKGKTFAVVQLPQALSVLSLLSRSRVTPIYLGTPTQLDSKVVLKGIELEQEDGHDCLVLSPWLDVERTVKSVENGIEVVDKVSFKTAVITPSDIESEQMEDLVGHIQRCAQVVRLPLTTPPKRNSLSKQLSLKEVIALRSRGPNESDRLMKMRHLLNQMLEKDPNNATLLAWVAYATRCLGYKYGDLYGPVYLAEALKLADKAVALDPKLPLAYSVRTWILIYQNDINKARVSFDQLFRLDPKGFETLTLAGKLSSEAKRQEDAEKWFLAAYGAATEREDILRALSNLSNFYLDSGNSERAVWAYQKELEVEPGSPWTLNNLSLAYNRQKKWDLAIETARKALALSDFGAAHTNLSEALIGKAFSQVSPELDGTKQLDAYEKKVEPLIMEAVKAAPDRVETLKRAAELYLRIWTLKKDDKSLPLAKMYILKAQEQRPQDPTLKAALAEVDKWMAEAARKQTLNPAIANVPDSGNRTPASTRPISD